MHGDLDCQISVRDLTEGLCQQVRQNGQVQWDLAGHGHLIPKPRHVGPLRSNQNDSLARGSPATSPPLCPIWLLVRRCMRPDLPMADQVHPLLWPGDPVPVTQTEATCC